MTKNLWKFLPRWGISQDIFLPICLNEAAKPIGALAIRAWWSLKLSLGASTEIHKIAFLRVPQGRPVPLCFCQVSALLSASNMAVLFWTSDFRFYILAMIGSSPAWHRIYLHNDLVIDGPQISRMNVQDKETWWYVDLSVPWSWESNHLHYARYFWNICDLWDSLSLPLLQARVFETR